MFKIYGFFTFNPVKVVLTAEELGLDYDYVHVDLSKGEHTAPEHLARHPLGRVPVLEHDGRYLIESASICRYLARLHDNRLYAADPVEAAAIDQTVDLITHHVGRWLGTFFFEEVIATRYLKREPNQAALAEAKGFLDAHLPQVDALLGERAFLAGDQVTLADTIAFPYFQTRRLTSAPIQGYANLDRWYADFAQRPSVARTKARVEAT